MYADIQPRVTNDPPVPGHNSLEVADLKKDTDKKPKAQKEAGKAIKAFVNESSFHNDPDGSYTGHPKDAGEKPVQDADDL